MANYHIQSCQEMTAEMQAGWSLIFQGYVALRKGVVDVQLPSNQVDVLTSLMKYTKILVATVLAHINNYKTIKRTVADGENSLQFDPTLNEQLKGQHRQKQLLDSDVEPAPFLGNSVLQEQKILRELVSSLAGEVVKEIQTKSSEPTTTKTAIHDEAEISRRENEMTFALQKYIKTNQLPPVRDDSQLRSTVSDLRSINTILKERADRLQAESLKLSSDKFSLMSERQHLLQRVQQLEEKIIGLNHANRFYRKIHRPSSRGATRQQKRPPSSISVTSAPKTISVGGVQMEPEVVEWLQAMYLTLENEEKNQTDPDEESQKDEEQPKTGFAEYVASQRK
eukprot:TRINITY_DN36813_c0_g1_i1.p1 TRINITY_DN36813_c0_g1~~TRINITY_DN36813_c0_g1_i1.p1  ORF type:complete len:338 (+),score=76.68 TRINITY_DN36813_c0_g1_i1:46-1059(+)